jgi:hypothetical protein
MRTSRFVNLTNYCIVEYMFDQLNSMDVYTDNFVLMQNGHLDIHQIVNLDGSYNSTKNIKDLTAVPIGKNLYVYTDSEKVPDYVTYDSKISETPINGFAVPMDQVRFHFVAGFDFEDFKGLILSVKHTENDGKNNLFANILLAPETAAELIIYNSKPLFLSNAVYDRYVDILVPSIKNINEEYKIAPVQSATFAAAITPKTSGYTGFIYNGSISIGLAECGKRQTIYTNVNQTYDAFEVTEYYEAPLSQSNEFDAVGAYINEATSGDFLEFYLTFNSAFPEELISILNRRNPSDDWIIIHQLSIFEQVGTAFINTARTVFFQEDRFDEPNLYRPVLKNANEAVSMAVDYLVRLTNRRTGEQIIREASFSLISPKKYGLKLINIPLLDKPQSQRIYNKIIKKNFEATKLFIEPTLNSAEQVTASNGVTQVIRTEYVPVFFNNNNISVSNISGLIKTTDSNSEVIFSLGKLRFVLTPFDNLIKIKVYTTNTSSNSVTQIPLDLNINSAKYRLVFETDSGKVAIDNLNDPKVENLSTGVIAFNVSKKQSETISNSKNRVLHLVSVSKDGTETSMYHGQWRKPAEQSEVDAMIESIRKDSATITAVQSSLDQIKVNTLNTNIKQDLKKLEQLTSTAIKTKAVAPVVNKFGIAKPKAINPNSNNAGKNL